MRVLKYLSLIIIFITAAGCGGNYENALKLIKQGDLETASSELVKIKEGDQNSGKASECLRYIKGIKAYNEGNFQTAEENLQGLDKLKESLDTFNKNKKPDDIYDDNNPLTIESKIYLDAETKLLKIRAKNLEEKLNKIKEQYPGLMNNKDK